MKLKRFNESKSEYKYKNDGDDGRCPVCESYNITTTNTTPDHHGMSYFYLCNDCDFEWYQNYIMMADETLYDKENGDEIMKGYDVSTDLFNENKLKAKKYNI